MSNAMNGTSKRGRATKSRCALGGGWPGLVFWLGGGIFRALGYFALMLGGICIARKDGLGVLIFELVVGHMLICAAEVINEMNDKRKGDSLANTEAR